ncbi:MAG: Protein translocase subunit SecA [candidate division WS6 bacterium OLB21]|uniref:Protein translocase subunit SecA n=1 Tax=candidate division WS6 bacterium OLB21 TaxID=1617427 RepID=A0A136KGW9_9BACT|nr:MAG: Protein translocase subunit SecA [candidate division WS6 bacterium OLB21]
MFDPAEAAIREATPVVDSIFTLEEELKNLSLEDLRAKVTDIRKSIQPILDKIPEEARTALSQDNKEKYKSLESEVVAELQKHIPQLFSILREVNRRKFGKPHFRVQLIASVILAQGNKLAELKTGEGKTQVFHLPAALYGLTGRGSHVITVNDYLARRDGEYAGHAMADLGISVGIITPQSSYKFVPDSELESVKGKEAAEERKGINIAELADMKGVNLITCSKEDAYSCDVVYGTNNEFGFDYLRDNMAYNTADRVQKELYFVIVDEADSILIDEARTPLIISAPAEQSNDLYEKFARMVKKLTKDKHYDVDEKTRSVTLNEEGVAYAEQLLGVTNLWEDYQNAHHLDNALKAEVLYKIDDEYIVDNGEVLIVDEFTGRVLPGRRYSEGLHQAIEAKEGVEIKRASRTMATITFQNFFKLYKVLAGGSGTIITEAEEFAKIFNLESYAIPTNKPVVRSDKQDKIYKDREAKFKAIVEEIITINKTKRPILVGTASIEDSEYLSGLLDKKAITHEVLNAKYHEREAQIVAKAGAMSAVTVATNMAGRGTDIPLGKGVEELGGLYIIGAQRHEARRIDNQLRGRGGRQGQPGTTQFFVALNDEIMRIQGGEIVQKIMNATKIPDDIPIQNPIISRTIESAQKKMEGHNFDVRKRLVDYDNVMNQQREIFYTRRYNILRKAEMAVKADSEDTKVEMLSEIKTDIDKILVDEIEAIVKKHFFAAESDEFDHKQLIKDFLDLADDNLIDKAIKVTYKDALQNTPTDKLVSILEKLGPEEIIDALSKIIRVILDEKVKEFAASLPEIYRITALQSMDELWTEHLNAIGDLREGISLRSYAQKDPLVEYKNEAFILFERFIGAINNQIARRILKIQRVARQMPQVQIRTNEDEVSDVNTGTREMTARLTDLLHKGKELQEQAKTLGKTQATVKKDKQTQIGRNDKVTVRYSDGTVKKDVKYKKVEADVANGKAVLVRN